MSGIKSGDRIRLSFEFGGVEQSYTGLCKTLEIHREAEDIVGPGSTFPTSSWVYDLGATFEFDSGVKVRVPPMVEWKVEVLERAKPELPTTPGSIVDVTDEGQMILAHNGSWYRVSLAWSAYVISRRQWKLVKDAAKR